MSSPIDSRAIRIFISSTFNDLMDERDILINKTFPILQRKAAERDVQLLELDLRWGITENESKSGKVVDICFREIENSIPFFIGIVGDRYGWIPQSKDLQESTTERYRQVGNYLERKLSVTEMEMQFGVLEREEDMHAFFFIKSGEPSFVTDEPEELDRLKNTILSNKRYPVYTFTTTKELSKQVYDVFVSLLDELYPVGSLSEHDKERLTQRAFMNNLSSVYVKDLAMFNALDRFSSSDKQFLVITGESGLGKSSLIANWVKENALTDESQNVIYYFVGNGGSLGSHIGLLDYLADEICRIYGFEDPKEQDANKRLERLFGRVATETKPLLIVIDAINQIIDDGKSKQLRWLPEPPRNIRMLFSTLSDDKTMDVFRWRRYPVLTVHPLCESDRAEVINRYLGSFGKKLTENQRERIVNDPQCGNTLVLKTLLNELVSFGVYEKLDSRIDNYLNAPTIDDFYGRMLKRYEDDFGEKQTRLFLSLIAVSRSGLAEHEILAISGAKNLDWSQFFCSFSAHLNVKNGFVSFSHKYVREAVEKRYLQDKEFEDACHRQIATYFHGRDDNRALKELPYHLKALKDYDALYSYLHSPAVLSFWVSEDLIELAGYWRMLKESGGNAPDIDSYWEFLPGVEDQSALYHDVLSLAQVSVDKVKCREIAYEYYKFAEQNGLLDDPDLLLFFCQDLGQPYYLDLSAKALDICLDTYGENSEKTLYALGRYGGANYDLACSEGTEEHIRITQEIWDRQNRIATELYGENNFIVASSLRDMALMCSDPQKAVEYGLKSIAICKLLFGEHHPQVGWSLNHTGCAFTKLEENEKALQCFRESYDCWYPAYGEWNDLVGVAVRHQGIMLTKLGRPKEGLPFLERGYKILSAVYGKESGDSLVHIGVCYYKMGEYEKSREILERAVQVLESTNGWKTQIESAKNNLNVTLKALGLPPR